MQIVYSGAHPEVVIDALNTEQVIKRGVPVTVPDDLGASLIEQDTWAKAQTAPAPTADAAAPTTPAAPVEPVTEAPVAAQPTAVPTAAPAADATNGN